MSKNNLSDKTKYIRLYEVLKERIISGIYPCGSKLPSKRILSEESNISLVSVEHSLDLLIDEGYIEARERRGYYVINLSFVPDQFIYSALFVAEAVIPVG